ncbi:MAG TPA: phosphatidate cytidylyltransferase [Acetobacteraceae bacterium]|nr:phosphatidate cytidylyltransferase [Acetobacteraceae bacterium]
MRPELRNRLVLGFGIGGLAVAGVIVDLVRESHQAILILGVIGMIAGCREFARLARHTLAAEVQLLPMVVVCVLLVLEAHLHSFDPRGMPDVLKKLYLLAPELPLVALVLGFGLIWTVLAQMFRHATERFLANVGATMLGMVYLGLAVNLLQRLALVDDPLNFNRGTQLILLFLAATKLGDVAAYFGGRALGKHKMAPRISPGKTWEGFACSFVGSIGGTYLFAWFLALGCAHQPFDAWWKPAVWALILGPLGVAGDLAESCLKRDAAVKDSGAALPGFGGFLDILDALILAAPAAYVLALML